MARYHVIEKRTLVKIGGSYRLTIPPHVIRGFGWKEGDELTISATRNSLNVTKDDLE